MTAGPTNRLGDLDPASLTGDSKKLYDDINEYFHTPYVYKLPNGRMVGPFGIELHTPGAGYAWLNMTKSLGAITSLPALAREVAILVTGYHENAAYEIYAHEAVSGLPASDLEQLKAGKCPAHLGDKVGAAFRVATELCEKPGSLGKATWEEAERVLGREALTAVVHYVGFYKYVSTILNGFDATVPGA